MLTHLKQLDHSLFAVIAQKQKRASQCIMTTQCSRILNNGLARSKKYVRLFRAALRLVGSFRKMQKLHAFLQCKNKDFENVLTLQ